MNDYGELIGNETVRFCRILPGPIDRVWHYLTDGDLRAKWLAGGAAEMRVGGRIDLDFHNASLSELPDTGPPEKYKDLPEKMHFYGEVTRCEPPVAFAHTWIGDDEASEVTYELEEHADGVLLTLTHRRITTREMKESILGGWHTHLDILVDILNERPAQPFWQRHTVLEAEYQSVLDGESG